MNIFKLLNPFAKSEESPCHKYLQGMAKSDMVVKDLKLSLIPWTFSILGFALGFLSLALYLSEETEFIRLKSLSIKKETEDEK